MAKKLISIRVDEEWLDALNAWRDAQIGKPTLTEVIRVAVNEYCAGHPPRVSHLPPVVILPQPEMVEGALMEMVRKYEAKLAAKAKTKPKPKKKAPTGKDG
jgi:hypothetical protein